MGRKTEDRRRKTEDGRRKTEDQRPKSKDGSREFQHLSNIEKINITCLWAGQMLLHRLRK